MTKKIRFFPSLTVYIVGAVSALLIISFSKVYSSQASAPGIEEKSDLAQNAVPDCGKSFWGLVRYRDLNKKYKPIQREEVFLFNEWSPHEQFDELHWDSQKFKNIVPTHASIVFSSLENGEWNWTNPRHWFAQQQHLETTLDPDRGPQKRFYVLRDLKVKENIASGNGFFKSISVVIERNFVPICKTVFKIVEGD